MIKQLFFTAALLVPGLAYAANPSATLSVQVIPAGPNNPPAPPAQAAVANFNTCVICMDFTAPTGGVWVNGAQPAGVNSAQPNTWLDCAGASTPIWFHKSNVFPATASLPCPDIVNDSMGNTRVLRMWNGPLATDNVNGILLYDWVTSTGTMVPTNNYMEATFIVPQFPHGGFIQAHWLGGAGQIPNGLHNYLEFDAFEVNTDLNQGAYASVGRSWSGAGHPSFIGSNWYGTFPPHYDSYNLSTQYLKIGERITNDGTTLYKCMWINDVFQNCVSFTVDGSNLFSSQLSDATSRMQTYFALTGAGFGNVTTSDMVAYAKSFYLWSCTNWQTTACRTGSADPGGY
jgi:hypothetical protein